MYFCKDKSRRTWNGQDILVESDRSKLYNDKRTQQTATPGLRVPFNIFGLPSDGRYWGRVQGQNRERRREHPNQLPEVYLNHTWLAYLAVSRFYR